VRFDGSTGNYEVLCDFVGPVAPLLQDIPLQYILSAPYMYPQAVQQTQASTNQGNNITSATVGSHNTSKGYEMLRRVYEEYKADGLIPADFPYMTLRELAVRAESMDKALEQKFFDSVIDPRVLSDMDAYETTLDYFAQNVVDFRAHLDSSQALATDKNFFAIQQAEQANPRTLSELFVGIIGQYVEALNNNQAFGKNRVLTKDKNFDLLPPVISVVIPTGTTADYVVVVGGKTYVSLEGVLQYINRVRKTYLQERIKVEQSLNEKINQTVQSRDVIGFSPTIRNVFAVVLAGADAFIRMVEEVHQKGLDAAPRRASKITSKTESLYPFPQITHAGGEGSPQVLTYPGDPSVRTQLGAEDPDLWPEVEFLEQYYAASAQLHDSLIQKEAHLSDFDNIFPQQDPTHLDFLPIFTWNDRPQKPYGHKTTSALLYEFYERAYVGAVYSGVRSPAALQALGHDEAQNLIGAIRGFVDLETRLKVNRNLATLKADLQALSPLKRWLLTQEEEFTTPYLRDVQANSLSEEDVAATLDKFPISAYAGVQTELSTPRPAWTQNLYPVVSGRYIAQLQDKTSGSTLNSADFSVADTLRVDLRHGLLGNTTTLNDFYLGDSGNIFSDATLLHSGYALNILNTPYFHHALQQDIAQGSFTRSAYLFLSALPLLNLYNKFPGGGYVFAAFSQYAATHRLPYLWILKLGAQWHRYKNSLDLDVFKNADVPTLFDGGVGLNLDLRVNGTQKTVGAHDNNCGLYPAYFDSFSRGVLGQPVFGLTGTTQSEWQTAIQYQLDSGTLKVSLPQTAAPQIDFFSCWIQNGTTLQILPSSAGLHLDDFTSLNRYQNLTTRLYYGEETLAELNFSGLTGPQPNEYLRDYHSDECSVGGPYKGALDLLSTFSPDILNDMEAVFLAFCAPTTGTTFRQILSDLCTLSGVTELSAVKSAQQAVGAAWSQTLTAKYYLLKLGNPAEVNLKSFSDFLRHVHSPFLAPYQSAQVTSGATESLRTTIGEDFEGWYRAFFRNFNIAYDPVYFALLRPVVRYYAGLKSRAGVDEAGFVSALEGLVSGLQNGLDQVVTTAFTDLNKIPLTKQITQSRFSEGFNDAPTLKLNLYNSLKLFNDRWVSGGAQGEESLLQKFLFFDRANRDIGDKAFVNLYRLQNILDEKNGAMSLYSLIGELLQDTGFIFLPLPSYVNFYGVNSLGDKNPPTYSTAQIANDLFGTFLEVDYVASSPKFLCQYVGLSSGHPNMAGVSDEYHFDGDSFDVLRPADNPLSSTVGGDFDKSNRVVVFEVNVGDPAQGIFKSLSLDQASIKNTAESYKIIEDLVKNESGSNALQASTGLWDVYRNRNYTCEVTAMGCAMIQPTMHFYLRGVPMFEGTYLITEVRHEVRDSGVETTFTGSRVSKLSLPDVGELLISTNKMLYQRLLTQAQAKTGGNTPQNS
jgi:hypothetical protein